MYTGQAKGTGKVANDVGDCKRRELVWKKKLYHMTEDILSLQTRKK